MDIGAHPPTRATAPDAVRLARELYGLEARPLPCRANTTTTSGSWPTGRDRPGSSRSCIPMRDAGFVDMQCAALRPSPSATPACPCPAVVPDLTRTGLVDGVRSAKDLPRLVWMLTYLPGRPIAGLRPVTPGLLGELGTTLARLDLRPGRLRPSGGPPRAQVGPHPRRLDPRPSRSASRTRAAGPSSKESWPATTPRSGPALPRLRRGVVYADANEHNVLVAGRAGTARPPGRPHRLRRHDRDRDRGRGRRRRRLRRLRRGRPARGRPAARRRLPPRPSAHRGRDRRPRHPRPHPPGGERRQLGLPGRGRARRSLSRR